ncbi:MAG TPA: hypothetical protein VJ698_20830 [Noviherbaspirillum sp.]|uniref:hypothetical protein n=1 Tax=Noviherbaspirillum sp. TaxID=1926288 RepID=UPI002B4A665D|nr:hypothetical protein [Noviherbaspirillum sp.]HJV87928.1 hypothetical protein [Noviherbaspirillum sp.]
MHPALRIFVRQYLYVVCAAIVPVVLTTFLSIPMSLGTNPGEAMTASVSVDRHLT